MKSLLSLLEKEQRLIWDVEIAEDGFTFYKNYIETDPNYCEGRHEELRQREQKLEDAKRKFETFRKEVARKLLSEYYGVKVKEGKLRKKTREDLRFYKRVSARDVQHVLTEMSTLDAINARKEKINERFKD